MEVVIDPTPPDTVEVLAGLIAELDSATTRAGDFYDDVCEALCRLTSMERAGTLLYDPATRAVRFVGSHGVDKEMIGEIEGTLDETPIAQRALAEDRVVEASEHLEREIPERYARFAGITTLTCTPVAAGGRWLGVIFADRGGGRFELSERDRQTMLTLGRLAALAASVEGATRQDERAQRLNERIGLVREIHDRVMQRLFGLVLALGSGEPLSAEDRRACHDELQAALTDLRSALRRPLGPQERSSTPGLRKVVERRAARTRSSSSTGRPPSKCRSGSRSWRNRSSSRRFATARSTPTPSESRSASRPSTTRSSSRSPTTAPASPGPAPASACVWLTLEALQQDALVEFGPLADGRWRVRTDRHRVLMATGAPSGEDLSLSVLVVDDHDVVHWGFRLLLERQPWVERCVAARTAEEALELVDRLHPDVALVDLFLGGRSGAELTADVVARSPDTRVLLISGAGRISPRGRRAAGARASSPRTGARPTSSRRCGWSRSGWRSSSRARGRAGAPSRSASARSSARSPPAPPTARSPPPLPLPAHGQGAHELDLSQARGPQPCRGREAGPAARADRLDARGGWYAPPARPWDPPDRGVGGSDRLTPPPRPVIHR